MKFVYHCDFMCTSRIIVMTLVKDMAKLAAGHGWIAQASRNSGMGSSLLIWENNGRMNVHFIPFSVNFIN
jgi:hypothetical protein